MQFESARGYHKIVPYKDKAKQRAAQLAWVKKRRDDWFAVNGPCVKCQSWQDLQLDHVDPKQKVDHKIWSWARERRETELAKCQALCQPCHKAKSDLEVSKIGPSNTAWCSGHQEFISILEFHKDMSRPNGFDHYCKQCHRTLRLRRAPIV